MQHFYYELMKDGSIRWNSTFYMIECAIELKDAIMLFYLEAIRQPYTSGHDIRKDELTTEDWAELEQLRDLLQPFEALT